MEKIIKLKIDVEEGKRGADGRDGSDGRTPIKGEDYFTAKERSEMVKETASLIPTPKNGKDGRDGKDAKPPTKTELRDIIKPLIPEPIPGVKGKDGKDGSPDTPKEVADKLNALTKAVDWKVLKNVPDMRGGGSGLNTVFTDGITVFGTGLADNPLRAEGGGAVDSVNGQTGVVVLDTDDIPEGSTNLYWRGWTRTLIVDQGGLGDYTTIKDACDYVATQTPTSTTPWQILVMSGKYAESPFSIPAYATVSGFVPTTWGNFDTVVIDFTSTITSGIGITMVNNSDLGNLVVKFDGFTTAMTGDITLISGANKVTGVFVQAYGLSAYNLIGMSASVSSAYVTGCTLEVDNFGAGGARAISSASANANFNNNLIKTYVADHWGFECTAGTSNIYGSVFSGPSSILRTAGTLNISGTSYTATSGTITFTNSLSVALDTYGAGWATSQKATAQKDVYDKIESMSGDITDRVPYTGATGTLNMGLQEIRFDDGTNYGAIRDTGSAFQIVARTDTAKIGILNAITNYVADLDFSAIDSSDKTITFQNQTGTVALLSDIPSAGLSQPEVMARISIGF